MSGHESLLLRSIPYGPADTIGILNGNIEKIPFTGGLIVGNGTLDHMPQVIELVAQIFHSHPTLLPCPVMRMFRIHRTSGIQISVRFLGSGYNSENTIDVFLQPLVGIGLQRIAGTLDGFVNICIVKRETLHLIVFAGMGSFLKVFNASRLLRLPESQRNSNLTAGFQSLPPEMIRHFYRSKRNRIDRIARM